MLIRCDRWDLTLQIVVSDRPATVRRAQFNRYRVHYGVTEDRRRVGFVPEPGHVTIDRGCFRSAVVGGNTSTAALLQDAIELARVLFDSGDPDARNGE